MGETTASMTGGCLCGAARFRLHEPPKAFGVCHCGMCRKFSGGIELGLEVPPGGITWESAETVRTYASSEWAERGFCGTCGSSLFWRLTAPGPMQGMLSLAAGALDSLEGLEFESEIYIDQKPSAYAFSGERKQMTEAEVVALFMGDGAAP